jgi:hypothetical protein
VYTNLTEKLCGGVIAASVILFTQAPLIVRAAPSGHEGSQHVRQIRFSHGGTATVLTGVLRPYNRHTYRFRARVGQEMSIQLRLRKEGAGSKKDLVFWVQSRGWYPPSSNTALLEGIDKGGVTNWSGILPGTGEYEIYVSNPPITDHAVRHSLPYKLEITIR